MKRNSMLLAASIIVTCSGHSWAQDPVLVAPAPEPVAPTTPPAPDTQAVRMQNHTGSLFRQAQAIPAPIEIAGDPKPRSPVADISYIAVEEPRPKKYKKHDLLTVVISELSDQSTTGINNSEKKQDFDFALQQFVQLGSGGAVPGVVQVKNPQSLPEVQFKYDNNRQNQAQQQRTDQFTARMQAEIIDVKPNGNLVMQATKHIQLDKEVQTFLLTGECRAADVQADNSVLSTQISNLGLTKTTKGEVRDGVRSGWFNSLLDHINPF